MSKSRALLLVGSLGSLICLQAVHCHASSRSVGSQQAYWSACGSLYICAQYRQAAYLHIVLSFAGCIMPHWRWMWWTSISTSVSQWQASRMALSVCPWASQVKPCLMLLMCSSSIAGVHIRVTCRCTACCHLALGMSVCKTADPLHRNSSADWAVCYVCNAYLS